MTIGCNIWMICLTLNWFFYGPSRILQWLQFSQFVWTLRSSLWDVFHNFLLIDATDRSKSSSDQKRFFIALSLYPLSFFANTPFKKLFFERIYCYIKTRFENYNLKKQNKIGNTSIVFNNISLISLRINFLTMSF